MAQVFDKDGIPKYYNVEPLLPEYTNFKKWNTNFGSVILDDHLLQAFSHWTHDITSKHCYYPYNIDIEIYINIDFITVR